MRVHASALKHGVLPEDAVQAADWAQWIEPLAEDDWPHHMGTLLDSIPKVRSLFGAVGLYVGHTQSKSPRPSIRRTRDHSPDSGYE